MSGSGISWAICKSAPRSRQTTTPVPRHSVFLPAEYPSCRPTNSVKALKARISWTTIDIISRRKRRVPVCVSCIVCYGLERYKLVLQQKNWNDASLYCQTQMDSKLVVIANLEEQLALTAFLEKALGRSSVLFRDKCKKLNSLNTVLEAKSHV